MGAALNKKDKLKNKHRKTRKENRKEKRKQKKIDRNAYYSKKNKRVNESKDVNDKALKKSSITKENQLKKNVAKSGFKKEKSLFVNDVILDINKEKNRHNNLKNEMMKNRRKQLQDTNELEDQSIKKLEKQLNLKPNKKKIAKSFAEDGLDYILELCDSSILAQKGNTGEKIMNLKNLSNEMDDDNFLSEEESQDMDAQLDDTDSEMKSDNDADSEFEENNKYSEAESDFDQSDEDLINSESDYDDNELKNNSNNLESGANKRRKIQKLINEEFDSENSENDENTEDDNEITEKNEFKEDIYGRKRDKDGNIVQENSGKYIPPHVRAHMLSSEQSEKMQRLKRQIKGLLNKLTELNIHRISSDLENIYMSNSHHDTNSTLTNASLEFLININSVPDIMMAHHAMLVSILHANVGSDIGAFYLQTVIKEFNTLLSEELTIENKKTENVSRIISHLYNFKIFSGRLLLDILTKLAENLNEKRLDCILIILRNSGFFLRKDSPGDLKDIILKIQTAANSAMSNLNNSSRIKFLIDVLLAIKNNNVSKIPSHDPAQLSHLQKLVKNYYRKGNYVTTLNVSFDDMLKADEHGRWWSVGSAWSGSGKANVENTPKTNFNTYSKKLLELAKKQRMNTEIRKNIFCTIMSGEDYLNAFEKVLHLGLKGNQEQELVHVLLSCCLQEKKYNPYYSLLAQKFCDLGRKYRISFQYGLWDKIRELSTLTNSELRNLAKFMIHLLVGGGLSLCVLKIIDFSDLQKVELQLIRHILVGVLLNESEAVVKHIFERILKSPKLKMFRESLRLFLHHFLVIDKSTVRLNEKSKELLAQRIKIVEHILITGEARGSF